MERIRFSKVFKDEGSKVVLVLVDGNEQGELTAPGNGCWYAHLDGRVHDTEHGSLKDAKTEARRVLNHKVKVEFGKVANEQHIDGVDKTVSVSVGDVYVGDLYKDWNMEDWAASSAVESVFGDVYGTLNECKREIKAMTNEQLIDALNALNNAESASEVMAILDSANAEEEKGMTHEMTYEQAKAIVESPGKFEGNAPWVVLAHEDAQNGCWQEECFHGFIDEHFLYFDEIDDDTREAWRLKDSTYALTLYENADGFVSGGEHTAAEFEQLMLDCEESDDVEADYGRLDSF